MFDAFGFGTKVRPERAPNTISLGLDMDIKASDRMNPADTQYSIENPWRYDRSINLNASDKGQEARDYIAKYKLKAHYRKELKDGTPRRIWELYDPKGDPVGRLYTAIGPRGVKNVDDPWEDVFDFAELMCDRNKWEKATSKTARLKIKPQTKHFDEEN